MQTNQLDEFHITKRFFFFFKSRIAYGSIFFFTFLNSFGALGRCLEETLTVDHADRSVS